MLPVLEHVIDCLETHLDAHPDTTEHALITHCQQEGLEPYTQLNLKHSRELFCAHFLTRHALYTLQNRYLRATRYVLHISATRIERLPYQAGKAALCERDPVKDYYLEFSHYFDTSEDEVNDLLNSFWQRFLANDQRSEALATLGLEADADYPRVKQRYRQLAQNHHPDKGGDVEEFQRIQRAKQLLDRCFGERA